MKPCVFLPTFTEFWGYGMAVYRIHVGESRGFSHDVTIYVRIPGKQSTGQRDPRHHGDTTDGGSAEANDHPYIKAALLALQRHADAIINISAVQVSPKLYSQSLISAETLSMVSSNVIINKYQMLTVFDDLKSKVAVNSSGFVKFVNTLRSYPEYEELANDLQGIHIASYVHIAM